MTAADYERQAAEYRQKLDAAEAKALANLAEIAHLKAVLAGEVPLSEPQTVITNAPEARYIPQSMEEVLTEDQCRSWVQMEPRPFADACRSGALPYMKSLGQRNKRFHVRTVLKRMKQETP